MTQSHKNGINKNNDEVPAKSDIIKDITIDIQESEIITKKINFNKNTLRNLVTMASHEYFDQKMKQDQMLSLMLEKIINNHYKHFITEMQPK